MTTTTMDETPAHAAGGARGPLLFQPFQLNGLELDNRGVVSPMCQYSCEACDGLATDWHLVHLGSRLSVGLD